MSYVPNCKSGYCKQAACVVCGTFVLAALVPGCTCETEIVGFAIVAKRDDECPAHGRCRCTTYWHAEDDSEIVRSPRCPKHGDQAVQRA